MGLTLAGSGIFGLIYSSVSCWAALFAYCLLGRARLGAVVRRVGGVDVPHLNRLEAEVAFLLDYRLFVDAATLDAARARLLSACA